MQYKGSLRGRVLYILVRSKSLFETLVSDIKIVLAVRARTMFRYRWQAHEAERLWGRHAQALRISKTENLGLRGSMI